LLEKSVNVEGRELEREHGYWTKKAVQKNNNRYKLRARFK